jgi:hypothetical protein
MATLLAGYNDKYQGEDLKTRQAEVEFIVPLPNGAYYTGKIDRIVEKQGKIYVFDTKTSGSMGQYFFAKYAYPHLQMDGYAWAVQQLVGECVGIIVDGISTADRPSGERYQRAEFYRTPEQLVEVEETIVAVVNEVEATLANLPHFGELEKKKGFLMRTTWCEQYGGCPYRELCAYGESDTTVARFMEQNGGTSDKPDL